MMFPRSQCKLAAEQGVETGYVLATFLIKHTFRNLDNKQSDQNLNQAKRILNQLFIFSCSLLADVQCNKQLDL